MSDHPIAQTLREHSALCEEVLALVMREKKAWADHGASPSQELYQAKKALLPKLNQSLEKIRDCRVAWQKMPPKERSQYADVGALLQQTQNLILKIIVLDRENEQVLLRRGLGPTPPPLPRQQPPHFVTELYRRKQT